MPRVNTEDLIDANDVAALIGLAHRNTVSQYLHKYPDMPRPVIDLGGSRARLWLRPEIEAWLIRRGPVRRGRPKGSTVSSEGNGPPFGGTGGSKGGPKPRTTRPSPQGSVPAVAQPGDGQINSSSTHVRSAPRRSSRQSAPPN
jgi:predicted DNA-binding transcriptional regulator AlpA